MNSIVQFSYNIIGLGFIISSLSKSLDFMSFSHKIEEYATILSLEVNPILYDILGIILLSLELLIGLSICINFFKRIALVLALFLSVLFSVTIIAIEHEGGINDCGCLGSIYELTSLQTLTKNIIIIFIIIFLLKRPLTQYCSKIAQKFISIFISLVILWLSVLLQQPIKYKSLFDLPELNEASNIEQEDCINNDSSKYHNVNSGIYGVIRNLDKTSEYQILDLISSLKSLNSDSITSIITASDLSENYYNSYNVKFYLVDNSDISNIIHGNIGIIVVNDGLITDRWQQNHIETFRLPLKRKDLSPSKYSIFSSFIFWDIVYITIIIITTWMPKNVNRVGKLSNYFFMLNLKRWLYLLSAIFLFSSCNQEQEKIYSCDETINAWVKNNIDVIHQMSRSEWLNTPADISRSIYAAFTHKQRIAFWQDKFSELQDLAWNEEELSHINRAKAFMESHLDFFSGNPLSDEAIDEVDIFSYKWQKYAIDNLGWSKEVIFSIIACGNKVLSTKGDIEPLKNNIAGSLLKTKGETCNCNRTDDWCGSNETCTDTDCDAPTMNHCGTLLLMSCNGYCILDN